MGRRKKPEKPEKERIGPIAAIKRYLEQDGEKVSVADLKGLSVRDRLELGQQAADALGVELEVMP